MYVRFRIEGDALPSFWERLLRRHASDRVDNVCNLVLENWQIVELVHAKNADEVAPVLVADLVQSITKRDDFVANAA